MAGGQDQHLLLGVQVLGLESGRLVVWRVEQSNVCASRAQQRLRLTWPGQRHLDRDSVRLRGVRVKDPCEQFGGCPRLGGQHQGGLVGGGSESASFGGINRLECKPSLSQQHRSGGGQRHSAGSAVQQKDSKSSLELLNRSRQRWLRHHQSLCRPSEMQFLGDGDEVAQLTCFHQDIVSTADQYEYPCGIARHLIDVGLCPPYEPRVKETQSSRSRTRPPMSNDKVRWLLKVIQPERTLASLPGGATMDQGAHAALLGIPEEIYTTELSRMREEASEAAEELLADPAVVAMVNGLPLKAGAKVAAFGDSLTSDPQSWAVILREVLARRRGGVSMTIDAVAGETTSQGLVRIAGTIEEQPDWVIFLFGTNDARTQGPNPTKTLVHHEETQRNIAELRHRVSDETSATALWITPPAVDEAMVANHWGLARFGVRYRNQDLGNVATIIRDSGGPIVDVSDALGTPPVSGLLMEDGLHFTIEGQKRIALEVIRGWSTLT